jgi:hypothetical protein
MKFESSQSPIYLLRNSSLIFYFLYCCLTSCANSSEQVSNQGNDSSETKTTADSTPRKAVTNLTTVSGDLYTLRMTKADYDILRASPTKKLLFQFYFKTADTKYPTLLAYASKNKNQLVSPLRCDTLVPLQPFFHLPAEAVFGDQQLMISDIDKFISDVVGSGTWTALTFSPDIKTNGHIFYKVTVEGVVTLTGALETNPSPPKDAD